MNKGRIIILNGPSSSGKTTLSHELQKIWDTPLYHLSYDITAGHMSPFVQTDRDFGRDPEYDFLEVTYRMAAEISRSGRDCVIDNCLFDTQDIYELSRAIMKDCPTVYVRVKLDSDELCRREKERGNRTLGKALWQEEHIIPKEDSAYDIIVNTGKPSHECAAEIKKAIIK